MSFIRAQKYLEKRNLKDRIIVLNDFSGTVIDAAKVLKTKPGNIVKTMALSVFDKPILILLSGDYKLSNSKFKEEFGCKPKMIDAQELDKVIGHEKVEFVLLV
jgi:prolyl-tRNA editing enzyme YbaK/EbsC (Cys-tRNA(Pro) deacylase)